jgi:hypothetical protein
MRPAPTGYACPSAQPDMAGARVIGVIQGMPEEPEIAYLERDVAIEAGVAAALGTVDPTEVFRYAAACETHRYAHFTGGHCSLATRIVEELPEVVQLLPRCQICATCRWFAEQGGAACRRGPQVVTRIPAGEGPMHRAAQSPAHAP